MSVNPTRWAVFATVFLIVGTAVDTVLLLWMAHDGVIPWSFAWPLIVYHVLPVAVVLPTLRRVILHPHAPEQTG